MDVEQLSQYETSTCWIFTLHEKVRQFYGQKQAQLATSKVYLMIWPVSVFMSKYKKNGHSNVLLIKL